MVKSISILKGMVASCIGILCSLNIYPQNSKKVPLVNTSLQLNTKNHDTPEIKPLTIGDLAPDIIFNHVINLSNFKTKTVRLSDFKDKLIILDFWATWCGSCIRQFHKLDSLKNVYSDQLEFLLINSKGTGDDENKIKQLFEKKRMRDKVVYTLSTAVNDSSALALFPHNIVPHYVWIGKDQKVIAITDYISPNDINSAINTDKIYAPVKKDFKYDFHKPLFFENNGGPERNIQFRSFLTGYLHGVPGTMGIKTDSNKMVTRIHCTNLPILELYKIAHSEFNNIPRNRIILEVANQSKYSTGDSDSFIIWKYNNTYSYELMMPPTDKSRAMELMREDLKRYFGLSVRKEKRMTKTYVLAWSGNAQKLLTKGGKMETNIYSGSRNVMLQNCPFGMLVTYLNDSKIFKFPVIDETNIQFTVDMVFPDYLSNFENFVSTLHKYGIELTVQEKELDVVIITDK